MLKLENEKNGKLLDEWREFAVSAGKQGQFESIAFLHGKRRLGDRRPMCGAPYQVLSVA